MSGYVKLSRRAARELVHQLAGYGDNSAAAIRAIDELKQTLWPRAPKPMAVERKKKQAAKKATKKERLGAVREAIAARAGGYCEACGFSLTALDPAEADHFFGRSRAESVETVWFIHRSCHRRKSANAPAAAFWLEQFIRHAGLHGYRAEAERARARLEGIVSVREAAAVGVGR